MFTSYQIAASQVEDETVVSRSRFICYLAPCSSNELAKSFIKAIQKLHPQANHHCTAFISGRPEDSQSYGFSDDGEPSGTAGKPMLSVLQGSNVGEIVAVVVRYFGGTKLGTGGLQRAYGNSVRQALLILPLKIKIPMVHKTLACQYNQIDEVLRLIALAGGTVIEQAYQADISLTLALPISQIANISGQLTTMSAGQLKLQNLP